MPLLNYTTQSDVEKTVSRIHTLLVKNKARSLKSDYDNEGNLVSLSFVIFLNDQNVGIKLPVDWKPVLKILENDRKVPRSKCTKEQALRVAWRIMEDWVKAQMAIIETEMVKMEQIFLPYIIVSKDGQTYFEKVLENPELLLLT